MRDIYFGMKWVEKELRWEIHNLVHNTLGYSVRRVWCATENEQPKPRTEPMRRIDCRKAGKQSCMGKYRFDINGWNGMDCELIYKQWDWKNWIPAKGWRYTVSKAKLVKEYSNVYYGGHYSIVNITLGKEYVEVGRFMFDFLCDTDCLFYENQVMVGKIWDIMKEDYFIIQVIGWDEFIVSLTIDPSRKSSVMSVFPIWKATLEELLKKPRYTNVDWDMRVMGDELFIEWKVK